jgi:hypothetical protein
MGKENTVMSKCKCECCNKPSFDYAIQLLEDLDVFRKLDSALVLNEDAYAAYCDGLRADTASRDLVLHERGIDNRMWRSHIVIPHSEYSNWRARRNHVTP